MHSNGFSRPNLPVHGNIYQNQFTSTDHHSAPPALNMPVGGGFHQNSQYHGSVSSLSNRPFIAEQNPSSLPFSATPMQQPLGTFYSLPPPDIKKLPFPGQQYPIPQPMDSGNHFMRAPANIQQLVMQRPPPPCVPRPSSTASGNLQTFPCSITDSQMPVQANSERQHLNRQNVPPLVNPLFPAGFHHPLPSNLSSSFPQQFGNHMQNMPLGLPAVRPTVPPPLPFPNQGNAPTGIVNTISGYTSAVVPSDTIDIQLKSLLRKFEDASLKPSRKENSPISVTEYSAMTKQAYAILEELEQKKAELKLFVHSESKHWNHKVKIIVKKQVLLCELLDKLSDPKNMNAVRLKLKKIQKKRAYISRQKKERAQLKVIEREARVKAHAVIDRFLDGLREKDEQKKREAEMKKEADCILSEVRKKIQEAKLTLKKLKILEKCRRATKEHVLQKGVLILPTHDRNFDNKLLKMRELLMAQMSHYEAEERALKVMLDTEHEGQREVEVQWRVKKLKMLQEKKHSHILASLFGLSEPPTPADPLFLFHQFYDAGNKSIDQLIEIRRSWDMHLVPLQGVEGSNVPQQWVVPSQPSSDIWASYLEQ